MRRRVMLMTAKLLILIAKIVKIILLFITIKKISIQINVEIDIICKNRKAKQLFQSAVSEDASECSRRSKTIRSPNNPPSAAIEADFDANNLSPLTSNLGDVGSGSSSIILIRKPIHFPPSSFKIGESHTFAIQMKPPKAISSNFSVMNPWCFGFRV